MSDAHGHALQPFPTEGDFEFTNGKFAMWLFLVSDAMAFIGFLGAYMVLRMTANASPVEGQAWMPMWSPPLDLVLTGVNTFVLICSSVTMVKALAAIQDGNVRRLKLFLACTMIGGAFFVGFQCFEWTHMIHDGITAQGLVVPDLDKAMSRSESAGHGVPRLRMAKELFGVRDLDGTLPERTDDTVFVMNRRHRVLEAKTGTRAHEGVTCPEDGSKVKLPSGGYAVFRPAGAQVAKSDFTDGYFTEAEWLSLTLPMKDREVADTRPLKGGVVHRRDYAIPSSKNEAGATSKELFAALEIDAEGEGRAAVLKGQRTRGARTANLFSSSFFVLTGFHGLHVLIGVFYLGIILFRAFQGAYDRDHWSGVEIAGLYWHFVDLVWVILFMLIYLI